MPRSSAAEFWMRRSLASLLDPLGSGLAGSRARTARHHDLSRSAGAAHPGKTAGEGAPRQPVRPAHRPSADRRCRRQESQSRAPAWQTHRPWAGGGLVVGAAPDDRGTAPLARSGGEVHWQESLGRPGFPRRNLALDRSRNQKARFAAPGPRRSRLAGSRSWWAGLASRVPTAERPFSASATPTTRRTTVPSAKPAASFSPTGHSPCC